MGENGGSRGRCVASPVRAVRGTRSRRGRSGTAGSGAALDAFVARRAARPRPAPGAGSRPGVRWFEGIAGPLGGTPGRGGVPAQPGADRVAADPVGGRPAPPTGLSEADARALHPARSGRTDAAARVTGASGSGASGSGVGGSRVAGGGSAGAVPPVSPASSASGPVELPGPVRPAVMPDVAVGRRPVRLTRRGRLVLFVLVLFVGALLGFLVATPGRAADPPKPPATAVVQPDDTLWSFAERTMPRWRTAAAVAELKRLNDLEGSVIHPGQRLKVPAAR